MSAFSLYDIAPTLPPIQVLDVGALDDPGVPAVYAGLVAAGHARVVGFEPDLQGCIKLNQKFGAPHQFYPLFAGAGGPAKFHQTSLTDAGSLYPPNTPLLELFNDLGELLSVVQVHDVDTKRIDD